MINKKSLFSSNIKDTETSITISVWSHLWTNELSILCKQSQTYQLHRI